MKRVVLVIAAAIAGLSAVAKAATLEIYSKLPQTYLVSLSPDGAKVAFVRSVNGEKSVVVQSLESSAVMFSWPVPPDRTAQRLVWADPEHLLVAQLRRIGGRASSVVVAPSPFDGRAPKVQHEAQWASNPDAELTVVDDLDLKRGKSNPILDRWMGFLQSPEVRMVKGQAAIFLQFTEQVEGGGAPALFSSDLQGVGAHKLESTTSPEQRRDWVVDDQGDATVQSTYDEHTHDWTLRVRRNRAWADAYSVKALNDPPNVRQMSPDGSAALIEVRQQDGADDIKPLSLSDGVLGAPAAQYSDVFLFIHGPNTERAMGAETMGMEPRFVFFDAKDEAGWEAVVASFPQERVEPLNWSLDHSRVAVSVTGDRHGVAYAVVDLATHATTMIGNAYDGIGPQDIAKKIVVSYPAADGLKIQAFLTLPSGRPPHDLPLVVLPHDGPTGRDYAGFDWLAQALASQGYAVLQPQFRGSTGFDWKFQTAAFGEIGRKMQSDLSDGVQALAAQGYIDPKRVCVVGQGYGGYAALAGVILQQGIYRCAASINGMSNIREFIGGRGADADRSLWVRGWDRQVGAKNPSDPLFDKISLVERAASADAPILLIHARTSPNVPIRQGWALEAALKSAQKPVEFLTLEGGHWERQEDTRLRVLQGLMAFLQKNNPSN